MSSALLLITVSLLLQLAIVCGSQLAAQSLTFSNLQYTNVHGMAVDGDFAYISGFATQSVYGQSYGGSLDAIFVKLYLVNSSVVWLHQINGSRGDFGGTAVSSFFNGANQKGVGVAAKYDLVLFSLTYQSLDIPRLPPVPLNYDDAAIAVYGRNGTFIKYILDFYTGSTFNYVIELIYSEARQTFFLSAIFNGYQAVAQITAATLNSTILFQFTNIETTTIIATSSDLIIAGKVYANVFASTYYGNGDLSAARYSLNNLSLVAAFQYGSSSEDRMLASTYNKFTDSIYFTGLSQAPLNGIAPLTGSGMMFAMSWSMKSNNLTYIAAFGGYSIASQGGGIEFDYESGVLVMSGTLGPSALTEYGGYDAVVCIYSSNLTLLNATSYGGASSDAGSTIQLPYVLLSIYANASNDFGLGLSGPALLSLSFSATTTRTSTSTKSQTTSTLRPSSGSRTSSLLAITTSTTANTGFSLLTTDLILQPATIERKKQLISFSTQQLTSSLIGDGKLQAPQDFLSLYLLYIVVAAAVLCMCCTTCGILYVQRRRIQRRRTEKSVLTDSATVTQPAEQTYQSMSIPTLQVTFTGNATTMIAGNEIAMPGFLQVQATLDYAVDRDKKPLAEGGGGVIRICHFLNFGVGVKMLRSGTSQCVVKEVKNIAQAVFTQEVALMWYFRNTPTIIEMYGFNSQTMIILLPLFTMGSLQSLIKNAADLPEWTMDIVVQLAIDIFTAIATVHAANVVHYDIKSLNYLVKRDSHFVGLYRVVLTDFGVCRILDAATKVEGMSINQVNGRTPAFTPPETLMQQPVLPELWPARDVYAGAVVCNELVTREPAWNGSNNKQIQELVLAGGRPSTTATATLANHERLAYLQQLIQKGWAQDPAQRPTAAEMKNDVASLQPIYETE